MTTKKYLPKTLQEMANHDCAESCGFPEKRDKSAKTYLSSTIYSGGLYPAPIQHRKPSDKEIH